MRSFWQRQPRPLRALILFGLLLLAGWLVWRLLPTVADPRSQQFVQWNQSTSAERAEFVTVQRDTCPGAPFVLPTDGWIGLLYEDPRGPYSISNPHQGIDVFSNANPGVTPVYAVADGYIRREAGWRSALIQRVPDDPLRPGNQIWLYYAHMADVDGNSFIEPAFPSGSAEIFVEQGTLLGFTGDYNGGAARSIWTHLHFSIVKDDGQGRYLNELDFDNTLDPSPYFGMPLNVACAPIDEPIDCSPTPTC